MPSSPVSWWPGLLFKALVEGKQAAEVFPINFGLKEPGILFFGTVLAKEQDPEVAKATLFQILEGAARPTITQEEVERAKAELLKNIDLALNQSDRLGISLSTYIAQGDWRLFFLERDRIKAVTAAQVQEAMESYLRISNRTLAQFIPSANQVRTEFAPAPDVAALVKNYQGQAPVAQGEAFDVACAAIEGRTLRETLPCGLKTAVVAKKTRGGSVSLMLNLHLGDEVSLRGLATQGRFCANMLLRGSDQHSRQQLQDAFDHLKAQVNVWGEAESAKVMVTTVRENLPEVLKLVVEALRHPAFPEGEFNQLRQEEVMGIQYSRQEPQAVGSKAFAEATQAYPVEHVRHEGSFEEDLAKINALQREELKAFHKKFYGPVGELAIVGDLDPKRTLDLVTSLLDGWKADQAYQRIPDQVKSIAPLDQSLETPDKANAFFLAGCTFPLRDDDADYPALLLANHLLGGGALKSRLADRIRQKEGISYGVGSWVNISSDDRAGTWTAYAIYNPANVAKLQQAFREEMERALKDGFTEKEIADAKLAWRQTTEVQRARDAGLAYQLSEGLKHGRTLAFNEDLEKKIMALGNDQLLPALRNHVTPDKLVIIKAGDFKKASAK